MKFDFYAWQKAGRPASRAFGSDGLILEPIGNLMLQKIILR
uniref:ORF soc.1 n=1 Tax=Tequatrovirus T2 TaxID=10664 RepID=Q94MW2_9CAUD|nr:ORF soc.1 [Escherichia phage T2]